MSDPKTNVIQMSRQMRRAMERAALKPASPSGRPVIRDENLLELARRHAEEDARKHLSKYHVSEVDKINRAQTKQSHRRIRSLYDAGCSEQQVQQYADAAGEAYSAFIDAALADAGEPRH